MTHLTAETWLRIGRRFAATSHAHADNDNDNEVMGYWEELQLALTLQEGEG